MLFGSLICKIRKYHKYSYYYSGECITCGKIRKEYEKNLRHTSEILEEEKKEKEENHSLSN
ncbi:MAG TPA: hypothetical protein VNR61_12210 [Niallia sp.]|nr:hypothetical protein [Niallia sp.]